MSVRKASVVRAVVYGAVGTLFVGSLLAIGITGPIVVRTSRLEMTVAASTERLRADVEQLARELVPRDASSPANLDRAAEWIATAMRGAGLEVELQSYDVRGTTYRNVIGFRAGLEPAAPVRVLGAHYDAYGPHPGADDNASGVAVLLEVVRTLQPEAPRRGQYFVAFSTAEPPFFGTRDMGSRRFAERLVERGVGVDLMVALDGVGYFDETPGSQRFPAPGLGLLYPSRGNYIEVVGDAQAGPWIRQLKLHLLSACDPGEPKSRPCLPILSLRAPAFVAGVAASDHRSFRDLGLPGVLVTDTGALRNRRYHTPEDTPETLDYERMADLVRGLHGLLWDRDVAE